MRKSAVFAAKRAAEEIQAIPQASYIMIGGFLGAGKTTAMIGLAQQLRSMGNRVGLITNDQGHRLVDTTAIRARGLAVQEITGGCFCCRFDSLVQAAADLSDAGRPDVFLAEPVGSCTDLVATVCYPLGRMYGQDYRIAPLSVLVDPVRALRILGIEDGKSFSHQVCYIYLKQIEEADVIVINKIDAMDPMRIDCLEGALASRFPLARRFRISARTGTGLSGWLDHLLSHESVQRPTMAVDYETYAAGEAELGWLNATIDLQADRPFDAEPLLLSLAHVMAKDLGSRGVEVAHLKMSLVPEGSGDVAVISMVRNGFEPEVSRSLSRPIRSGQAIINLRAQGEPQVLRQIVAGAVATPGLGFDHVRLHTSHLECFRPGRPQPTHRVQIAGCE